MKRPWALPLEPLYRAVLATKNASYTRGLLPVRYLRAPVISVGSLSAGGAGKTPVVLALTYLLASAGISTNVLSRGYGRSSKTALRVSASGDPDHFGDEPLELARSGAEVFVGADRHRAGLLAEQTSTAAVHLLDDGFQHRRLGRALNLVLLTMEDVSDRVLPGGNLREPLAALGRADVVVVRSEECEQLQSIIRRQSEVPIWKIDRRLKLPPALPRRPFVFCAIARPQGLLRMLRAQGIEPAGVLLRRDHHRWTMGDAAEILTRAKKAGADGFLTTAKDEVKLSPDTGVLLARAGPLSVAGLEVAFVDPEQVLETIRDTMRNASLDSPALGA